MAVTAAGLLSTDDRDAASSRMSTDIMRDGELAFDTLNLEVRGQAARLQDVRVDRANAGCAGRMAKRLQATVGVDGEVARQLESAVRDVVLCGTLFAEPEIFVGQEFREREAVVHLCDAYFLGGVGDPGHFVDVVSRPSCLRPSTMMRNITTGS